jgi:hypothetical protein
VGIIVVRFVILDCFFFGFIICDLGIYINVFFITVML